MVCNRFLPLEMSRVFTPRNSTGSSRGSMLKRKYDLTVDEYTDMLRTQHGVCAICGDPPPENRNLHVDHDHKTGKVRALLCTRCNAGLGMFRDEPMLLARAIAYLDDYGIRL